MTILITVDTLGELLHNTIAQKEFSVLSKSCGEELQFILNNESIKEYLYFHVEPQPHSLFYLYKLKAWRESQERLAKLKLESEQNRQLRYDKENRVEAFKVAMRTKGKQPSEIVTLLEKIFTYIEPYYSLGVRYNLIDKDKVKPVINPIDKLLQGL